VIFQTRILIPSQTIETVPCKAILPIQPGYVDRAWVGFPQGCYGLAHVQLWRGDSQLLPLSGGESLAWNNFVYDMPLYYLVMDEPLYFIVKGWNEDDSYAHRVTVMVSVVPLFEYWRRYGGVTSVSSELTHMEI